MIDLRKPVNLPPTPRSMTVARDTRFPTWMYHAVHGAKEFKTEQAFNAAGDGWVDSPAKLGGLTSDRTDGPTIDGVSFSEPTLPALSEPTPVVTGDLVTDAILAMPSTDVTSRAFTPEELKSVHKEAAGDIIDAVERSKDVAFVQFVLDVERVNPVKPRPTVIQAAETRLAKLTDAE